MKVEKEPRITKCHFCNGEFEGICYEDPIHLIIPPDKHFEGAVEGEGWYSVFTVECEEPEYEYASTRDLDALLKWLAISK